MFFGSNEWNDELNLEAISLSPSFEFLANSHCVDFNGRKSAFEFLHEYLLQ